MTLLTTALPLIIRLLAGTKGADFLLSVQRSVGILTCAKPFSNALLHVSGRGAE